MVRQRLVIVVVLLFAIGVVAADPRDRGPDTINVSSYPEKYQELYKVFEVKCSKCHGLSRAINAKLRPDEWALYVRKMKRRQGSGITEANAQVLIEFLTFYANKQQEDAK